MLDKEMNEAIDVLLKSINQEPKSQLPTVEITMEEYDEYLKLWATRVNEQTDFIKGYLNSEEQKDLIKATIKQSVVDIRAENTLLKAQLEEQTEVLEELSRRPQLRKSISSIVSYDRDPLLKKSGTKEFENIKVIDKQQEELKKSKRLLNKSEMLDIAENLFKSGKLKDTHVIELENSGRILDAEANQILQSEINKQN